jgi:hypothetical protein
MILKVFKAVWFLSLMILFGVFFYVYASLPEWVTVHQEGVNRTEISREGVFYSALAAIAVVNTMVFLISRLFKGTDADFASWFYGLVIALNGFFAIALSYVSLFNSGEKFQYDRLGIIIYGSISLVVLWAISWPIFALFKKYGGKPAV